MDLTKRERDWRIGIKNSLSWMQDWRSLCWTLFLLSLVLWRVIHTLQTHNRRVIVRGTHTFRVSPTQNQEPHLSFLFLRQLKFGIKSAKGTHAMKCWCSRRIYCFWCLSLWQQLVLCCHTRSERPWQPSHAKKLASRESIDHCFVQLVSTTDLALLSKSGYLQ